MRHFSRRSAARLCAAVGMFVAAAFAAGEAAADIRSCNAEYYFKWGWDAQGSMSTKAGMPCQTRIWVTGNYTIHSVQIVVPPRHGTAVPQIPGMFRYTPRAGYTGADSVKVRFIGTTGWKRSPAQSTVTFAISVY